MNKRSDDYQNIAPYYDFFITPLLRKVWQDVKIYLNHKGYRKILDVCCGTGSFLQQLEGAGMELVGIDNSLAMLERAREKNVADTTFHCLDAEQEFFEPESFDCAIISFGLHEKHPAVCESIYTNTRRTVRQEGSLILIDYQPAPTGFRGFFTQLGISVIERLAGSEHYQHYRNWMQQEALEGFLRNHRETVDIISLPFGGSVMCCAVQIRDARKEATHNFALLNQTIESGSTI